MVFINTSSATKEMALLAHCEVLLEHRSCKIGRLWLDPIYRPRNLMDEAMFLLTKHAFEHGKLVRVQCTAESMNAASQKLILRTQFKLEGLLRNSYISKCVVKDIAYFPSLTPSRRRLKATWWKNSSGMLVTNKGTHPQVTRKYYPASPSL